jgi:Dyp-type peroxidase family
MAVTLNAPISWQTAVGDDSSMLDDLQPNILKAHTRYFLAILFLQFTDAKGGRAFLRDLSTLMKSAKQHLLEIQAFKGAKKTLGSPYVGVGLTAAGYGALGVAQVPGDPSFRNGMQATTGLNDPGVATWDAHFRKKEKLHAIVLIGDMGSDTQTAMHRQVVTKLNTAKGVVVLGTQDGHGQHNNNGEGIEHFGYVDGRSQPLFFTEDILDEENGTDGIANWSPSFPLAQAIVPDPAAPNPTVHFGSYFIFRKLEQNVQLFKSAEKKFAKGLGLSDEERAGGMIVGRFEDGTPVTMQSEDGVESPVPNNFNYDSDQKGAKCPFLGHIRKTNPRGSGGFGQTDEQERKHLMARRGQTYGVRVDNPNDGKITNKPKRDVGLLFMAFNSDIGKQFEFTQITWANDPGFPQVPAGSTQPGVDPVIGQTPSDAGRPKMTSPKVWGDPGSMVTASPVPRAVTMKGGEYFFMPSLACLRNL